MVISIIESIRCSPTDEAANPSVSHPADSAVNPELCLPLISPGRDRSFPRSFVARIARKEMCVIFAIVSRTCFCKSLRFALLGRKRRKRMNASIRSEEKRTQTTTCHRSLHSRTNVGHAFTSLSTRLLVRPPVRVQSSARWTVDPVPSAFPSVGVETWSVLDEFGGAAQISTYIFVPREEK